VSDTVEASDRRIPGAATGGSSLPALLLMHADERPRAVAMRVKELGLWREITWAEYLTRATRIGLGLAELGVGATDRVAVLSENRPEWLFADLGIQGVGAVTVGIYPTGSEREVAHVLEHSAARVVIVEDQEQFDKVLAVRDQLPGLEKVAVVDTRGIRSLKDPLTMSLEELEGRGKVRARSGPDHWREAVGRLLPEEVAVVVYTSGAAGPPQGVMLSHGNLVAAARATCDAYGARPDDEVLSYLPLCHVAERLVSVAAAVQAGYVVNFGEGGESFLNDLRDVQPTFFLGVPRVWDKLRGSVEVRVRNASWLKRRSYVLWQGRGARLAAARRRGENTAVVSRLFGGLFLYRSLRQKLGLARVRIALSGAAPIAPQILDYFWSLGVPVREAYGQTENTALATYTPEHDVRLGSVGVAFPNVELRVADDGEILVRSPGNFVGYVGDEAATRAALGGDGWLRTGDLGELGPDGFLKITGRKREIIVTAGGLNVSPQHIENELKVSPYVREAVVIGDRRPFLTALVGIELDAVVEWAGEEQLQFVAFGDLASSSEVRHLIEREVGRANERLSDPEQIHAFELLPVELEEAGAMTVTQKVRRRDVVDQFGDLIEKMYAA
jgi:long-chain acyl-CoA synthetase